MIRWATVPRSTAQSGRPPADKQLAAPGFATLAVVAMCLLGACAKPPDPPPPTPEVRVEGDRVQFPAASPQLGAIRTAEVTIEQNNAMRIQGRVGWDETRTARIDSPVAGRITKLLAAPGDRVVVGQPLAEIVSPEIGQAQADARRAETDLDVARKNLARVKELADAGVVPRKDLLAAEAEQARAAAERDRAAARTRLYAGGAGTGKVDMSFALRSPVAGVVVQRHARPGLEVRPDMAQDDTPALFVISDPSKLWAYIDIPESVANRVVAGQTLMLHSSSLPNRPIHARVAHVADFIDPNTRMLRARAEVDNGDRLLKAEMFINGDLSLIAGNALTVPASAVFLSGDHYYAFVEEAPGRFVRREVDAEEGGFDRMRVLSGLKSGERVVTDGALLLQHVMAVRR